MKLYIDQNPAFVSKEKKIISKNWRIVRNS